MGGIAILLLVAGVLGSAHYVRRPRLTPALRGYDVAAKLGCFACHGPGGMGGVSNPGSDEDHVPAWDGGNAMMYVQHEREIREWILDGHPKRLEDKHEHSHEMSTDGDHDTEKPFTLHTGSTVSDLAVKIHKEIAHDLKYARVWGPSVHDGQSVRGGHVLEEGDVVEIHR